MAMPRCRAISLLEYPPATSRRIAIYWPVRALVGNVVVHADLSIDKVNLKDRIFTGFYKVIFHGTGNAAGSGYYRAVVLLGA